MGICELCGGPAPTNICSLCKYDSSHWHFPHKINLLREIDKNMAPSICVHGKAKSICDICFEDNTYNKYVKN